MSARGATWSGVRRVAVLAASFLALTFFYVGLFGHLPRDSDYAGSFLAGLDMFSGNWRLAGWWLPPDPFVTTDIPLYGLTGLIFGMRAEVLLYVPAALWAGLTMTACATAMAAAPRASRIWALGVVLTLVGLPMFRRNPVMDQVTAAPMHVGSLILVLAMFMLAGRSLTRPVEQSRTLLAWLGLVVFLAAAGDPLVLVVGVLPVLGATIVNRDCGLRSRVAVGVAVLAGCTAARLVMDFNASHGGVQIVHSDSLSLSFASYARFVANLGLVLQNLIRVFGAWFFDARVTDVLPELLRLSLLLLALLAVSATIGRIVSGFGQGPAQARSTRATALTPLDAMLALGVLLDVVATVLSRVAIDDYSTARYLFPTLVFGAILAGRVAWQRRWAKLAVLAAAALSIPVAVQTYRAGPGHVVPASARIEHLADWLQQRELASGYGPYNASSIVTVVTHGAVTMRPAVRNGQGGIDMLRWLTSAAWYPVPFASRKPDFVVVDREAATSTFAEHDVIATFGRPTQVESVQDYTVLLYGPRS